MLVLDMYPGRVFPELKLPELAPGMDIPDEHDHSTIRPFPPSCFDVKNNGNPFSQSDVRIAGLPDRRIDRITAGGEAGGVCRYA